MPQHRILPYSAASLTQELDVKTRGVGASAPVAVEYLCGYLDDLKAASIVIEERYVDRHFLDDFASYYARSFRAPEPVCGRLHFFAELDNVVLERLLTEAYAEDARTRESATQQLNEKYLGFVVRRPLRGAAMGRTVLRTYAVEGRRHFEVVRPYNVHIGGVRLRVHGLAYQQQDGGAAVCASTALWSALQRVAFVSGHRTPTPSAITDAARSPFPASAGLNEMQMAAALSNLGYIADAFAPTPSSRLFRAKLVTYLQSQLPVILLAKRTMQTAAGGVEVGHAVTVTGYSEPTSVVDVPVAIPANQPVAPLKMRFGAVDVVYVHDDNLGSHAHYELWDRVTTAPAGSTADPSKPATTETQVMLKRGRTNKPSPAGWNVDDWEVYLALVPKPPKLRVDAESLLLNLLWLRPVIEQKAFPGIPVIYETRFTTGVQYKQDMVDTSLDRSMLRDFVEGASFPRHIGVLSVLLDAMRICDFIIDVSQYDRNDGLPPVLAVVASGVRTKSAIFAKLQAVCARYGWPLIARI